MNDEVIERVASAMAAAAAEPWVDLDEDDSGEPLTIEFTFTREEWRNFARAATIR